MTIAKSVLNVQIYRLRKEQGYYERVTNQRF